MSIIQKIAITAIVLIALIALALILVSRCSPTVQPKVPAGRVIIRDTVLKIIKPDPIIINKIRTRLIRTADTIIRTNPFRAELDTILQRDTIRMFYEFPANLLSLDIRRKPDTSLTHNITLLPEPSASKNWWESPAILAIGVIIGYLIAK
jgi:hypothetical protein